MAPNDHLPDIALSVRQPWAWAILHGGKVIENRSAGAIRSGGMRPGRIALHAAGSVREDEYRWALWRLHRHGVVCPPPDSLVYGAIIGAVTVTEIVSQSDSPWFGGPCGLVLADPQPCDPIPSKGALGYFHWEQASEFVPIRPWMQRFDRAAGTAEAPGLFESLAPSFREPPARPCRPDRSSGKR